MSDIPPNGDFMPGHVDGEMKRFVLLTEQEMQDENNTKILRLGSPSERPVKCVLLLGETGAGKSTFINGVLNYLNGITFAHDHRLCVKDQMSDGNRSVTESQTDYITVYKIHHKEGMRHSCDYIFIDTPSLGDTRGQEQQQKIMKALEVFLTSDFGIDELHCVGLVANATTNRHSSYQKAMLDEIKSLLGHHVPLITNIIATHATDITTVDQVMRKAGVQFAEVFEFDNYIVFADSQSKRSGLMAERWKTMLDQYNTFFSALLKSRSVSVKLLREKKHLDITVRTLKQLVEKLAGLMRKMELDQRDLSDHKVKEEKHRGWQQTRLVPERIRGNLKGGFHAHNCSECTQTCIICPPESSTNIATVAVSPGPKVTGKLAGAIIGIIGVTINATKCNEGTGGCMYTNGQEGGVCGVTACGHSLSQHKKERQNIMQTLKSETFIVEDMKEHHEQAIAKIKDATKKIETNLAKIQNEKSEIVHVILKMWAHFKNVQKLSMVTVYANGEELIDGILNDIQRGRKQNFAHVKHVLNLIKKAAKKLEEESVTHKDNEVMEIFESLPEGQYSTFPL